MRNVIREWAWAMLFAIPIAGVVYLATKPADRNVVAKRLPGQDKPGK